MTITIAPHSIDPQTRASILDTVKSGVSSMAGKLRDIFNTLVPGRTASWTPSHSGSTRSSFASSMTGSFSTRSSILSTGSDESARRGSSPGACGDSLSRGTAGSSSTRSSIVSTGSDGAACRDSSSCSSDSSVGTSEGTSWLYGEGLRHIAQGEMPHILKSPSDVGMDEGWRLPRISLASQSRSSTSSAAVSIDDLPNPWMVNDDGSCPPAEFGTRSGCLIPRVSQDSRSQSNTSSDVSSLSEFDFLDSMSSSSKA
jgi:hypothetical protein